MQGQTLRSVLTSINWSSWSEGMSSAQNRYPGPHEREIIMTALECYCERNSRQWRLTYSAFMYRRSRSGEVDCMWKREAELVSEKGGRDGRGTIEEKDEVLFALFLRNIYWSAHNWRKALICELGAGRVWGGGAKCGPSVYEVASSIMYLNCTDSSRGVYIAYRTFIGMTFTPHSKHLITKKRTVVNPGRASRSRIESTSVVIYVSASCALAAPSTFRTSA